MKSAFQTLAFVAALSTTASAAISLGVRTLVDYSSMTQTTENVAWISGEDPCSTEVYINQAGSNPCGTPFTLNNGYTYFEQNCGGSGYSLANDDGSFNSECVPFSDNSKSFVCARVDVDQASYPSDYIGQSYVCG